MGEQPLETIEIPVAKNELEKMVLEKVRNDLQHGFKSTRIYPPGENIYGKQVGETTSTDLIVWESSPKGKFLVHVNRIKNGRESTKITIKQTIATKPETQIRMKRKDYPQDTGDFSVMVFKGDKLQSPTDNQKVKRQLCQDFLGASVDKKLTMADFQRWKSNGLPPEFIRQ